MAKSPDSKKPKVPARREPAHEPLASIAPALEKLLNPGIAKRTAGVALAHRHGVARQDRSHPGHRQPQGNHSRLFNLGLPADAGAKVVLVQPYRQSRRARVRTVEKAAFQLARSSSSYSDGRGFAEAFERRLGEEAGIRSWRCRKTCLSKS
ncbi:hypothetical protein [Bradyrhizobium japonicum]|uniref:hypothetical protein n=1 Tax=Bradyrhizobium japonicum TaxID=375 RepID=UPI00042104A9|nr:hypothetical protein [Bradyrhizobium japonicum]